VPCLLGFFFYARTDLSGFGLANVAAYQYTDPAFTDGFIDCDIGTAVAKSGFISHSKGECHCVAAHAGANRDCYGAANCHVGATDDDQSAASYRYSRRAPGPS
jgi:hypothetical protein